MQSWAWTSTLSRNTFTHSLNARNPHSHTSIKYGVCSYPRGHSKASVLASFGHVSVNKLEELGSCQMVQTLKTFTDMANMQGPKSKVCYWISVKSTASQPWHLTTGIPISPGPLFAFSVICLFLQVNA